MSPVGADHIRLAARSIAHFGDTDIFPFPFENHVINDDPEGLIGVLQGIGSDFGGSLSSSPVQAYSTLSPVTHTGFRWATQIDPFWNAYLLSLCISLGDNIEAARVTVDARQVFSYRYSGGRSDPNRIFENDGWSKFQAETRARAANCQHVVSLDISDFYSRIYHHRLENALNVVDPDRGATKQIMKILSVLSNNTSYGLPVGGAASRLLAELVLNRVDRLLGYDEVTRDYCRYADDYRFFVDSVPDAYRVIGSLSEKLQRNEGLALQKGKTRIMTAAEYLAMLSPEDPVAGSADAFMAFHIHYDPYSANAEQEFEELKASIREFDVFGLLRAELRKGQVHTTLTRRLVRALKFLEPDQRGPAILSVMDNIEALAPVLPQTLLAVPESLDGLDGALVDRVHDRIRTMIANEHYLAQVELNRWYMLRVLATRHTVENEIAIARHYEAAPPGIQRDIVLTLARWGALHWLSDLKNRIGQAHPWVRRAFIVASYRLGDEGQHWRAATKSTMSPMEKLVRDWAAARVNRSGWEIPL
ncbi:RNA-directed DNA polymerase [Cellulomonas sp. C5510]|uniref:RNA-directed DNA polymerase n=1 Tax=Cellulomonas sp. C5510 TaxID=2871170 RepID=UPI001C955D0E|nr:RNA-directed DNA polymerase [Cellulomonas sp. C5510]QZN85788.1 RNA-directed DNA polymerase [Cellulomonas sp. C5510]